MNKKILASVVGVLICLLSQSVIAIDEKHWLKILDAYPDAVLLECSDELKKVSSINSVYCIKTPNLETRRCKIHKISIDFLGRDVGNIFIAYDLFSACIVEKVAAETDTVIEKISACHLKIDALIGDPSLACVFE